MREWWRSGLLTVASCALAWLAGGDISHAQNGTGAEYLLAPRDVISISVAEEPSFDTEASAIGADGTVEVPILGSFRVAGSTASEAAEALRQRLEAEYLRRASVEVKIVEYVSKPITVLGAVHRPGNLQLAGEWTLFAAITAAGGLTPNHDRVAYVRRRAANGLSDQLEIDLEALMVEGDPTLDIPLRPNDVIRIPPASEVTVYFLGEVAQPGAVKLQSTEKVTLLGAIARAGGLTDRAAHKITIRRTGRDGVSREVTARYDQILEGRSDDVPLENGDVVVVKESFF